MSAKTDLYNEIGQLKEKVEQLQREAVKVPKLEEQLKSALADAKFFKRELEKTTVKKVHAEKFLGAEREAKKKLAHEVAEARQKQHNAEKQVHRLQSDLKFDKMAREGQVKKSRIMEHQLEEFRHDNFLQTKLRSEAEHRAKTTNVSLQKERSLRLQDIHMRNKVIIEKRTSERNEKIAEFERFKEVANAKKLESEVGGLKAAVKSQQTIIQENDLQYNELLEETEEVRNECDKVKEQLRLKEEEVLHHAEIRHELEIECHRLQTELMISARTASERSRPLSTAMKGRGTISLSIERAREGKTRPETTSSARIRRRAQTVRSREFSRTCTQIAARGSTAGSATRPRHGTPGTPGGRGTITLDEAFIIPMSAGAQSRQSGRALTSVLGDLGNTSPTNRPGTNSVTFGESTTSTATPISGTRLPSAMKKSRLRSADAAPGEGLGETSEVVSAPEVVSPVQGQFLASESFDDLKTSSGSGDLGKSDPFHVKLNKMKKKRGTLNVPGSLFLGSGLGLKKGL